MATTYDIGDVVRISGSFTDTGGAAYDPSLVYVNVETPDGTVTQYTDTSTAVSNPTSGKFTLDVTCTGQGVYEYRFTGSSGLLASQEGWFSVRRRRVTT